MEEFQKLYEKNYTKVYYYLVQLSRNEKLSEDLAQDTFYNALVFICRKKDIEITGSWFLKIAHNLFIDYVRKNKMDIESLDLFCREVDASVTEQAYKMDFFEILRKLPIRYRSILLLSGHYGFTYQEISQIMNCSEAAVKITLHRARERFKEVYKEYERQMAD